MIETHDSHTRLPGLYRLWDLQFVVAGGSDFRVEYVQPAGDGTPLFAVWRRDAAADLQERGQ